jgi:hypothetical protein
MVVEGSTEASVFPVASSIMEASLHNHAYIHFDPVGLTSRAVLHTSLGARSGVSPSNTRCLAECANGSLSENVSLPLRSSSRRDRVARLRGGTSLSELSIAVLTFVCLTVAAFVGLFSDIIHTGPPQIETNTTVRMVANIFVVMTSLVLGLMLNSAKNTLETYNRNVHALGTNLILLDRTMRGLGPAAGEARQHLVQYVQVSLQEGNILEEDPLAETSLDAVGASLRAMRVSDDQQVALWNDARLLYRQIVQQRWVVIDQAGGTIPTPLVVMLIVWLTAIFASFGYQAPRNGVVTGSLIVAALLVSSAIYLILDMDAPVSGLVRTSNVPFQRALAQLQR